jgi:hypothetical protein
MNSRRLILIAPSRDRAWPPEYSSNVLQATSALLRLRVSRPAGLLIAPHPKVSSRASATPPDANSGGQAGRDGAKMAHRPSEVYAGWIAGRAAASLPAGAHQRPPQGRETACCSMRTWPKFRPDCQMGCSRTPVH